FRFDNQLTPGMDCTVSFTEGKCAYEAIRSRFGRKCVEEDKTLCEREHLSVVHDTELPGYACVLKLTMHPCDGYVRLTSGI
ncbi:hypothetical protein SARC_04234, partial [Sphaeroforma arctica JP610]